MFLSTDNRERVGFDGNVDVLEERVNDFMFINYFRTSYIQEIIQLIYEYSIYEKKLQGLTTIALQVEIILTTILYLEN